VKKLLRAVIICFKKETRSDISLSSVFQQLPMPSLYIWVLLLKLMIVLESWLVTRQWNFYLQK